MPISTPFSQRLGLQHPIIQAPMAGGPTTVELVAAVCRVGVLGSVGAAYLTPQVIADTAAAIRERTDGPFAINLFVPLPEPPLPAGHEAAVQALAPFHAELGLPPPALPTVSTLPFDEQLAAVLESGAAVFSTTFGVPPAAALQQARARGMLTVGTATTVAEARTLREAGVDAVVAQGSEAGGHRGSFAADFAASLVGTMALVPQMADAVDIPVIASGGIMDGRGIAAALALGAQAVQMGTAFLTTEEAGIPAVHKTAIRQTPEHLTRLTRAFSGRPARGIVNRFMDTVERPETPETVLPYPLQNALTRPMRTAAAKAGQGDMLSLWAGQGLGLARAGTAAELVAALARETDAALQRLTQQRVSAATPRPSP
jgi:nitronate monooxygenase